VEREEEEEEVAAKKKQDSDEEGKEKEERDQEEGDVAAALDNNYVSHGQVDTYACDHAKQGIETQIASDNHTNSVSEGIDGCESAKNEPDDIEKDDTDDTGKKEVMGGSVQVDNQFSYDNIDENANDQSKYQPDPNIDTEIPKGTESECKDGGDTSINVPGDNVPTDVISPPEGASEEKSNESPVLPSNAPLRGKALQFQQYLEAKNNKKNRKRKKEKKQRKEEKKKKESKRNYKQLIPTAKNRTGHLQVKVAGQHLYHDVFSTYMHHFIQDDPHPLKYVICDIMKPSSSLPKRCTICLLAQLNSMVSSWTTNGKVTTVASLLVFEDNVGEYGLSSQSTYKVNIDDPYYKAFIAPNPKVLNDLKLSKEQLEKVYQGITKEVYDLRL
jgi:hypothetical protein